MSHRPAVALLFASLASTSALGCGARTFLPDGSAALGDGGGGGGGGTTTTTGTTTSTSTTTTTTTTTTGTGGGPTGPIISFSDFSFMETETDVDAAPNGFVAAAWIAITGGSEEAAIGVVISTDDGNSFPVPSALFSPDGRAASDPVLAVDSQSNFYLTWVGFRRDDQGQPFDMHIYVTKAAAGSTSFGPVVEASDPNLDVFIYDKPWIEVAANGNVVVTYAHAANGGLGLTAARSADGGQSWQQTMVANDPAFNAFKNLAFLCGDKNGTGLYATYLDFDQNDFDVAVHLVRSDDGGASWTAPTIVAKPPAQDVAYDDPTCYADAGQVWVLYGVTDEPMPQDSKSAKSVGLRVAHSPDGGASIDGVVDAHDTVLGGYYIHAQLAGEPGGALDLVTYSGKFDEDDNGSYRRSRSAGPGLPFGASVAIEQPLLFLQERASQQWLGDYTGVAWRAGNVYTTYATNTLGTSHVAFARVLAQ